MEFSSVGFGGDSLVVKLGFIMDIVLRLPVYHPGSGFNISWVQMVPGAGGLRTKLVGRMLWIAGVPFWGAMFLGGFAASLLSVDWHPCLRLRGPICDRYPALTIISLLVTTNAFISESFCRQPMAGYSIYPRYYAGLVLALGAIFLVHRLAQSHGNGHGRHP
jgi:hypothetical protein